MSNKYVKEYENGFIDDYNNWKIIIKSYNERLKEHLLNEGFNAIIKEEWLFNYDEFCINFLNKANKNFNNNDDYYSIQQKLPIIFTEMIKEKYDDIKNNHIQSSNNVLEVYELLLDNKLYMR